MSQRLYRDSVIYRELAADDDDFEQFVRAIRSERATGNIASDLATITLSGLAVVTGGANAKRDLAAISQGLLGAKNSVDKELFNLEALSAIISRMRAARLQALVPIKAGMTRDADAYPLEQALFDLRSYANAGTLSGTLAAISNDAGEHAQEARNDIRRYTRDAVYHQSFVQRRDVSARIRKLTDAQALALAKAMAPHMQERNPDVQEDIASLHPDAVRLKTAKSARSFLLYWILQDSTPEQLKEWTDNLDQVEGAGK